VSYCKEPFPVISVISASLSVKITLQPVAWSIGQGHLTPIYLQTKWL